MARGSIVKRSSGNYAIVYYVSYEALEYSEYLPLQARTLLVGTEAAGLFGDLWIDVLRGKPNLCDEGTEDSVLPIYITEHWDPSWARRYLPGIGYEGEGANKTVKVEFRY
jgi:hypothetical protein